VVVAEKNNGKENLEQEVNFVLNFNFNL